jgi:hypothetical protein
VKQIHLLLWKLYRSPMLRCLMAAVCRLNRSVVRRRSSGCPLTMRVQNFVFAQALEKQSGHHEAWRHLAYPPEQASRVQTRPSQSLQHSARPVEDGVLEVVEAILADERMDERVLSVALVSVICVQSESERTGNGNGVGEFASDPVPSVIRQREHGERWWVPA